MISQKALISHHYIVIKKLILVNYKTTILQMHQASVFMKKVCSQKGIVQSMSPVKKRYVNSSQSPKLSLLSINKKKNAVYFTPALVSTRWSTFKKCSITKKWHLRIVESANATITAFLLFEYSIMLHFLCLCLKSVDGTNRRN